MEPVPRRGLLKHRMLVIDPSGRWAAPLKQALADLPCQLHVWRDDFRQLARNPAALGSLAAAWQQPGQTPTLVLYHCQTNSLEFLRFWSRVQTSVRLPPLIGLLDSIDPAAAERLRQLGCIQVHAGFHTWDRLVKTVTSVLQSPVSTDQNLEALIAANLPWSS